jgi:hypothetical protein
MWDWVIWGALIAAALTGSAASALFAKRALKAWRDVENARREVVRRLEYLSVKAEAAAKKISTTGDTAELKESVGRLRVALERLRVLRSAIDETQEAFRLVTAVVPRK